MSGPAFQLEGDTIRRGGGDQRSWGLGHICSRPQASRSPPLMLCLPREWWPQAVRLLGFLKEIKGKSAQWPSWSCWVGVCSTAVQPGAALQCKVQPAWCTAWFSNGCREVWDNQSPHPQPTGGWGDSRMSNKGFHHFSIDPPQPHPTGGWGGA